MLVFVLAACAFGAMFAFQIVYCIFKNIYTKLCVCKSKPKLKLSTGTPMRVPTEEGELFQMDLEEVRNGGTLSKSKNTQVYPTTSPEQNKNSDQHAYATPQNSAANSSRSSTIHADGSGAGGGLKVTDPLVETDEAEHSTSNY